MQTVTPWKIKLDLVGKGMLKESESKRDETRTGCHILHLHLDRAQGFILYIAVT